MNQIRFDPDGAQPILQYSPPAAAAATAAPLLRFIDLVARASTRRASRAAREIEAKEIVKAEKDKMLN